MLIAAQSTTHRPCSGRGYARDRRNNKCYQLLGAPIARGRDIGSKALVPSPSPPAVWEVVVELRPEAASRLDQFAVSNPGGTVAIISGSAVIAAAALNLPPYRGRLSINDPSWTKSDAQRVVNALAGHDLTHNRGFIPAPTAPTTVITP